MFELSLLTESEAWAFIRLTWSSVVFLNRMGYFRILFQMYVQGFVVYFLTLVSVVDNPSMWLTVTVDS